MGGALSSADDISELSSDSLNNTKQNTKLNKKGKNESSTDAVDDGKPKILPLEEYAAQLKRMTSEIDSIDEDSDGGEGHYSGEDKQDILSDGDHHDCGYDQNDDDDIQSFILPYSSRLQLAISYSDADQEMQVNVIRANDIPGADSGGPPAYQIYLCVLPDSELQWKSKLRTAPNPEFLEQWTFNIPLISIHQSTLLCTIIGHYGVGKEFPYGNAILPMEKLNLNTENVLTLHFEPKYVHAAYLTPLSSTKLQRETNDSEAPQNLQIIPVDRPTLCPENENITALNVQLPKVLLSLRLNPDTGRLECCLQQITLVDLRVGNRIPKRSIFVKIVIRTEEEGKLAKTHSGYHERQSTIHMNETFAFAIKHYQIDQITLEVKLMRRRPIRRKGATIGTCKIGKFNTSEDEVEHWEHVIASKDQCISQWHKFYPIPLTMPPGKSSAVSKTNQIETPMTD